LYLYFPDTPRISGSVHFPSSQMFRKTATQEPLQ